MRRIFAAIMAILCCFQFAACSGSTDESVSETTTQTQVETTETTVSETEAQTETEIVMNEENVKLCGRTELIDDVLWCAYSGTGATFNYTGKGFDLKIKGDGAVGQSDSEARVAVFINGERTVDFMVDEPEVTVRIAESEENVTSEIKIVKLSEAAHSTIGIEPITIAPDETIEPVAEKELKMEFIGDSITCGYGVDDEVKEHHFSTTTEDVTKAYGYKTAELMDADVSFVSLSGWGIISGYTSDPNTKADSQQLPLYYDKLGYSYQKMNGEISPQDVDWDFSRYTPDIIVINLGTNDNSYCKGDKDKRAEYKAAYKEFMAKVRENNPDAEIFCVLGIMGAELFNDMGEGALEYADENSDEKIHIVKLPTQDGTTGYAADWHPTEKTHEASAEYLVGEIKTALGMK